MCRNQVDYAYQTGGNRGQMRGAVWVWGGFVCFPGCVLGIEEERGA